ncbi:MAG: GIY-YIG nuclease family protein [Clostridia bacterium]|nr:GIY-YIG nuclease family protein [Clostridia bacterium]
MRLAYVYILECEGGELYTGITTDIGRRFAEHKAREGVGAKYTRSHPVKALRGLWETEDMRSAARIEWRIKRWPRKKKLALIADPSQLSTEPFSLPGDIICRSLSLEISYK